MEKFANFTGLVSRIALWGAGIGLVLMTAMIAAQVFWRYVLNNSLVWSEPASVMTMGWFIFLGAAVGIREGYHLSFEVVLYLLSDGVKDVLFHISDAVVLAFGVGMIWFGWQLAARTAGNSIPSLGISGAFDFAPIVIGGVLVVLFSVERIARRLAGLPTARFGDVVDEVTEE
ncbi:TRAP transporter small permease [Palleronia sp. LCG004]|uniref:TRAP transporter small permease n=1 Tax=Palleronia sp. LCG004 TaxID=3079304 RepID=UPI002942687D|nr:TRAP transporter small permease [Palleronia sp. LCG004]WOI54835.1 TRAP transporter small permease [Palleronia sp. LCG004]